MLMKRLVTTLALASHALTLSQGSPPNGTSSSMLVSSHPRLRHSLANASGIFRSCANHPRSYATELFSGLFSNGRVYEVTCGDLRGHPLAFLAGLADTGALVMLHPGSERLARFARLATPRLGAAAERRRYLDLYLAIRARELGYFRIQRAEDLDELSVEFLAGPAERWRVCRAAVLAELANCSIRGGSPLCTVHRDTTGYIRETLDVDNSGEVKTLERKVLCELPRR